MNQDMKLYFSPPALISACGTGRDALWDAVSKADASAIRDYATADGNRHFPVAAISYSLPPPKKARYDTKIIRMESVALDGLDESVTVALDRYGADRLAVAVGSCDNASETSLQGHRTFFKEGSFPTGYRLEMQGADYPATYIKERYGIRGPAVSIASACSSSASAIVKAAQLIRGGLADAVIVGGIDIASDLVLLGFASMECISPKPTNPFSRNRAGISLGEAAVFFVLSKDPLLPNGPSVTLAGYGESADAYHVTSPDPSGEGAALAMQKALRSAGIGAGEVGYVNLHGTGTQLNDAMEAKALSQVLGSDVPCSATKSITGHSLGAAGALSVSVCYETLVRNAGQAAAILPAQSWDGDYDGDLPRLNIIDAGNNRDRPRIEPYCMSNSFGFGGANVSLILKREDGND